MDASPSASRYRTYWTTWLWMLGITFVMLLATHPGLFLVTGMAAKAALILFVFMHLRQERNGLIVTVLAAIFLTSLVLFGLIAPDGRALAP